MLKNILFEMIDLFLNRKQIVRLSKAMLNRALGNNNANMTTNGEFFLLRQVLRQEREAIHKFVAFDVGANVGQWTTLLLDLAEELPLVHCFEPSPVAFSKLQAAIAKHRAGEGVFCINAGLSDLEGTRALHINEGSSGINSFYKRRLEGLGISYNESETVQVTTVDAYCRKKGIAHIDFLKIDVEGHEFAVMQGAKEMLKNQAIDYMQFEYGGCWIDSRTLFLDVYDFAKSFGYIIGKIMPKGIEFFNKYDQRLETFQMANFLACKPDYIDRCKRIKQCLL